MPSLIERRGLTIRRIRFNELAIGKSYLEADTAAGPYSKADENHRWSTSARNSLTPVSGGTRIIDLTEPGMFPLPLVNHNVFRDSIPSQGAVYDGVDPVLGPPFAPVFYQLFVDLPSSFGRTSGVGGEAAHLYWTIPDVSVGLQFAKAEHLSFNKYRVWFGPTNNIAQATGYVDVRETTGAQYIYPSAAYVWSDAWTSGNTVPPPTPVIAGTLMGTGTGTTGATFNGEIRLSGTNTITFHEKNPAAITFFALRRWHTNGGCDGTAAFNDPCTDATNLGMPLSTAAVGTTTNGSFITPAVGATVDVTAVDGTKVAIGQDIFVTTAGLYTITNIVGNTITIQSKAGSNNVAAGTVIATAQRLAPVQYADDPSDRDPNTHYFYQLHGHMDNNAVDPIFPFNNVGLIHPYPAPTLQQLTDVPPYNINPNGDHKYISINWTAPTAAEVASWPSSAP